MQTDTLSIQKNELYQHKRSVRYHELLKLFADKEFPF